MRPNNFMLSTGLCGTASFTSSASWFSGVVRASFQVVVSSGSCVGTFQLQGSNDKAFGQPQGVFQPTNWNVIGSSTTVSCSSTATVRSVMMPATELAYEYCRVVFTDGSAAAALGTFNVNAKTDGL